jgi:diadenosine tetraphosphate (Ap4A) HIT family hydrolase
MSLLDTTENINKAMLDGLKAAIISDLKSYLQKDVDSIVEEIAKDVISRYYMNIKEMNSHMDFGKHIHIHMLYGDPNNPKKYENIDRSEIVEVK